MKFLIPILTAGVLLSGCTIHPLPEDKSGDTTLKIVQKLKCEGHEAMRLIVQKQLTRFNDPVGEEYAKQVAQDPDYLKTIFQNRHLYGRLQKKTRDIFRFFSTTAVGLDFKFDIKEVNKNGFTTSFLNNFSGGRFNLGINGNKDLQRQNIRLFMMASSFYELYHEVDGYECQEIAAYKGDIKYPITGKIGMHEVFDTFIDLHLEKGISLNGAFDGKLSSSSRTPFQDTLSFTTTLKSHFKPSITLNPVSGFHLAEASYTNTNDRIDLHQVRIALVRNKPAKSERNARNIARANVIKALEFSRTQQFFDQQSRNTNAIQALQN